MAGAVAADGARLIATPEYSFGLKIRDGLFLPGACAEADHPVLSTFSEVARKLDVWFLLGSRDVQNADGRISNRSCQINAGSELVAQYDKIDMFDVNLDSRS